MKSRLVSFLIVGGLALNLAWLQHRGLIRR